jgi:hypothetical protein
MYVIGIVRLVGYKEVSHECHVFEVRFPAKYL